MDSGSPKTVEGRALLALDQAWPIWRRLQPDDEHLQMTRVLPGGGRPGGRSAGATPAVPRPATPSAGSRPVQEGQEH